MDEAERRRVRKKALSLFRSGIVGSALVERRGSVAIPIPVQHPEGGLASWFVPTTVDDRIVGFFQFHPDAQLLRYASLQRDPQRVDNCPAAATWLDHKEIEKRAATLTTGDEEISSPFLTYDNNVSKLAWAVKATKRDGKSRLIFVAGDYVYPEPDRSEGPVTG